jgi:hypothetical protein
VDQIISIQTLARAVIALLLHQPNNAYATPSRVLKSDYDRIFSENHNRDMFVACMMIHRQVDKFLGDRGDNFKDARSIIRYFVSMAVACTLLKKVSPPSDKELASLLPVALKALDPKMLEDLAVMVLTAYVEHGGTESVAKGPEMRGTILKKLAAQQTPVGELGL